MLDDLHNQGYQFTRKDITKIIFFVIVFGFFVAAVSIFVTASFGPSNSPIVKEFIESGSGLSLSVYFIYVIIACIIIPIPTLPADKIFLKLGFPVTVIALRLLAD